ncbi:MAG: cell wall-binding repeat-containing protein [Candidatus Micrarchaeota archaeon]|nr:cell wall-binding repeat-containing protein [Candidatus Micrarchaeota archaeon]
MKIKNSIQRKKIPKFYTLNFFIFVLFSFFLFFNFGFCTTVIVNSIDYKDILAAAVYAKHYDYNFLFALTPNQSVFMVKYYTLNKDEPIIYLEGKNTVLANMASLLKEANLKNLSLYKPENIQFWVADRLKSEEAFVVGSIYGQDGLAVSSYAALIGAPIFFYDPAQKDEFISYILLKNYSKITIYGTVNSYISQDFLSSIKNKEIIDKGSRYLNNLEIVKKFLAKKKTNQAIFVSGYSFEKSMIDKNFPILLVGRSIVPSYYIDFIKNNNITIGIVFSGDADIVDGTNYLKNQVQNLEFFVKFGEGYRGSSQPLPLAIIPLPSPFLQIDVLNLSYNVPLKVFDLKVKNLGDPLFLAAAISIEGVGSGQSSQIFLDKNKTTSFAIPLDASTAIVNNKIKSLSLTINYGEDSALMDNLEVLNIENVLVSNYVDNSTISLIGISYNSKTKEFVLAFDGEGWVEGTISFNINNRAIVLQIPLTQIKGITKIAIKYFLTEEEENYVSDLDSTYFFRYGSKNSILLKEKRGQNKIVVLNSSKAQQTQTFQNILSYIGFFILVVVALIIIFRLFFTKRNWWE